MKLVARMIDIITLFISSLLVFRILLRFLGANTVAPFVAWLYTVTDSFMAPFAGIFPTPGFGRTGVIDIPALFAMIVYLGAGYFISEVIDSFDKQGAPSKFLKFQSRKKVTPATPTATPQPLPQQKVDSTTPQNPIS